MVQALLTNMLFLTLNTYRLILRMLTRAYPWKLCTLAHAKPGRCFSKGRRSTVFIPLHSHNHWCWWIFLCKGIVC